MIRAVIGLGFGDEGKGVVTATLVAKSNNPVVVRFNGGHQAGHTVVKGDHRHVFSSFGSGTLHGAPTYWSRFCTIYPHALLNELTALVEKGVFPTLYIDPMCPVTTPFDVFETTKTKSYKDNGTVGVGFGATIARQEAHYTLYARDLEYPEVVRLKLQAIATQYYKFHMDAEHTREYVEGSINDFIADLSDMLNAPGIRIGEPANMSVKDLIFEGAQGVLLDQRYGFFPHVTRSNTTSRNILQMGYRPNETYLVTRAYHTRHGNGPLPGEMDLLLKNNEKETNVLNAYQGEFRKAPLNRELLKYAAACEYEEHYDGNKALVVTCCDQIHVPDWTATEVSGIQKVFYNSSPEGNFLS